MSSTYNAMNPLTFKTYFWSHFLVILAISISSCEGQKKNNNKSEEADAVPVPSKPQERGGQVFIQPYKTCKEIDRKTNEKDAPLTVCAQNSIAGATHEGYRFSDIGSCEVVRTQRPFVKRETPLQVNSQDERLLDPVFKREYEWVTSQVRSTGCACCHDSTSVASGDYAVWDIASKGVWTDQLTTRALGLLTNRLDATTLGAYDAQENFGFDRKRTAVPTTDPARMGAFFEREIKTRGIKDADFIGLKPLGGPLLGMINKKPEACSSGVGVNENHEIRWEGPPARYIYIMEAQAKAPIVPPNLDLPEGTLWRLDVIAKLDQVGAPLASGLKYGTVPPHTVQRIPLNNETPPALVSGQTYRLHVLPDVPLASTSCLFIFP